MSARILKQFAAVLATFTMTAGVAPAASIAISDLTDGSPIVTLSSDLHFLVSPAPVFSPERVSFSILPDSNVGTIPTGTRSVILTEPSVDNSDFVSLTAFMPVTVGQRIDILF